MRFARRRCRLEGSPQPVEGDAAQPDGANEALVPHRGHHCQLVVDVHGLVAFGPQSRPGVETPEVDDRDLVDAEASEVVLDARPELLGSLGRTQRDWATGIRVRADLAHHQDAVLGLESFLDEAVDEAVAVEMRGVDVVDAQLGRTPQESDRRAAVVMETLKLHRAVADSRNGTAGE